MGSLCGGGYKMLSKVLALECPCRASSLQEQNIEVHGNSSTRFVAELEQGISFWKFWNIRSPLTPQGKVTIYILFPTSTPVTSSLSPLLIFAVKYCKSESRW